MSTKILLELINQLSKLQDTKSTYEICILYDMCVYIYMYIKLFFSHYKKGNVAFFHNLDET